MCICVILHVKLLLSIADPLTRHIFSHDTNMVGFMSFLDPEGSLSATTVILVVTRFRKMPKALLIHNGKLRNFPYTFVTSFPTDLPS